MADVVDVPSRPGGGARPRPPWRAVAVPAEHGGWGFTTEPALLGLLIAPSLAGAALLAAALVLFLARTPVRVVLVDRHRGRWRDRTGLAATIAAGELVAAGALVALAILVAPGDAGPFWVPVLLAAPLLILQATYDRRSRSRELIPELAGAVGVASLAAAVALIGGATAAVAGAAWLVIAARVIASVPFVRAQLARGRPGAADVRRGRIFLGGQAVAAALVLAGAVAGPVPSGAAVAVGALVTVQLLSVRRPPPRAAVIGAQQLVLGLAVVGMAAYSFRSEVLP